MLSLSVSGDFTSPLKGFAAIGASSSRNASTGIRTQLIYLTGGLTKVSRLLLEDLSPKTEVKTFSIRG